MNTRMRRERMLIPKKILIHCIPLHGFSNSWRFRYFCCRFKHGASDLITFDRDRSECVIQQ